MRMMHHQQEGFQEPAPENQSLMMEQEPPGAGETNQGMSLNINSIEESPEDHPAR